MPTYALGHKRPKIHPTAWVHPTAVLIGDVRLGPLASVWPNVVIRADNSPVWIGARSSVQDGSVLHTHPLYPTTIGNDVVIGHLAHLEGCIIEDLVLVGSNSVVLEQAVCRSGSLIAASAVVTAGMEIPAGALAVGTPAKIKPNAVDPERIRMNVKVYVEHLIEHRDTMEELEMASCITEDIS